MAGGGGDGLNHWKAMRMTKTNRSFKIHVRVKKQNLYLKNYRGVVPITSLSLKEVCRTYKTDDVTARAQENSQNPVYLDLPSKGQEKWAQPLLSTARRACPAHHWLSQPHRLDTSPMEPRGGRGSGSGSCIRGLWAETPPSRREF